MEVTATSASPMIEEILTVEQRILIQQLIDELKSGKYEKARNKLRTRNDGFCCLGVACHLHKPENWEKKPNFFSDDWVYAFDGSEEALTETMIQLYGFGSGFGELRHHPINVGSTSPTMINVDGHFFTSLVAINDASYLGDDFTAVIAVLEAYLTDPSATQINITL